MATSSMALMVTSFILMAALVVASPATMVIGPDLGEHHSYVCAVPYSVSSNDVESSLTLFSQDYTGMASVPANCFQASVLSPYVTNTTLTYNETSNGICIERQAGQLGELFVTGLSPTIDTTYFIQVSLQSNNFGSYVYIYVAGLTQLYYQILNDDSRRVIVYYYSDAGALTPSDTFNLGTDDNNMTDFYVEQCKTNQTVKVYTNETTLGYFPEWRHENRLSGYTTSPRQYVKFNPVKAGLASFVNVAVHNVTQTMSIRHVTPICTNDVMPNGLDGTHQWETIDNGTDYLAAVDGRGTLWIDISDTWGWNNETHQVQIRNLLDNESWELGIHYSEHLTGETWEDAISIMETEYNMVASRYGQNPKSFCSIQNDDNYSLANWAYANLNEMLWRNGPSAVHSEPNVGNLDDATYGWWENASMAACIYPYFTHETDLDPAIEYSISYGNYTAFVDNYTSAGITFVPFAEWYLSNTNTFDALPTSLAMSISSGANMVLPTNGRNASLRLSDPWVWPSIESAQVIDTSGVSYVNASAGSYSTGLYVASSGIINISMRIWSPSSEIVAEWETSSTEAIEYSIYGLDRNKGYRIYHNGSIMLTALGGSFSFTMAGGGEFSIEEWYEREVSAMVVLTVNMVGLGIVVSIVGSFVMPIAEDIRKNRPVKMNKLFPSFVRTVIFIIIGLLMWSVLHTIAIG